MHRLSTMELMQFLVEINFEKKKTEGKINFCVVFTDKSGSMR
jgi:hypothetical protein